MQRAKILLDPTSVFVILDTLEMDTTVQVTEMVILSCSTGTVFIKQLKS